MKMGSKLRSYGCSRVLYVIDFSVRIYALNCMYSTEYIHT